MPGFACSYGRIGLAVLIGSASPFAPAAFAQDMPVTFSDAGAASGIVFPHENGTTPEKYMPETMGSGGLIFDYDNDGWPDIFLVNGGSFVDEAVAAGALHRLYRNDRNGSFTETTDESGIGVSGFGMGACSADYDNDGWTDLYVTSVETNRLYRNRGDGSFDDATLAAGVGSGLWSSSCAFGDIDNDGDVDLYVTNYVDFGLDNNKYCSSGGVRDYCHPHAYNGLPDILYRNEGDGTFSDISREAGIYTTEGKGLGVVFSDYDDDGWLDIYVANDSVPNFMYRNRGGGAFEESGMWAGVAVGIDGRPLAGMGTDMADGDGDGLVDVFVTNLNRETHSLYRNLGGGLFSEATFESGVGAATLPFVGFGAAFFDYDNDGDMDLAIANGDVLDRAPDETPRAQANLLLRNDGSGHFESVGEISGPGFALEKVSRALAVGDLDNDGDLDLLVTNNGQTADVLRNEGGQRNNSVLIRLKGSGTNRDGIGVRLRLGAGGRTLIQDVKAGSSYLGQNDSRVHFGLGQAPSAGPLEIRWPGGAVERIDSLDANQILTITEGQGVTERMPFEKY